MTSPLPSVTPRRAHRGARRWSAVATLTLAVAAVASCLGTGAAGAGVVADDPDVVRDLVFPVVGPARFTDTFGACRGAGCSRGHEGTDVMAPRLTPLVAVRDARVSALKTAATPDGSSGNYVFLTDEDGWSYWYIHLNNDTPGTDDGANPPEWIVPEGIERGTRVRAGQLIGWVGDSGNAEATAPHLHFEVHDPNGAVVNPYRSLVAARRLAAPLGSDTVRSPEAALVTSLFADFLGRDATGGELAEHEAALVAGTGRDLVVRDFAGSEEWVSALLDGYYRDTLGRPADARGKAYWTGVLRTGRTPASVAADFYGSAEYRARVGGSDETWLVDLHRLLLERVATARDLAPWLAALTRGAMAGDVAHDLFQDEASRARRVRDLYRSLLGRDPDAGGLAYWTDILGDGHDLRLATFLAASDEYAARAVARFG